MDAPITFLRGIVRGRPMSTLKMWQSSVRPIDEGRCGRRDSRCNGSTISCAVACPAGRSPVWVASGMVRRIVAVWTEFGPGAIGVPFGARHMIKRFTDISGRWGETVVVRRPLVHPQAGDQCLGKLRGIALSALAALALVGAPMAQAEDKRTPPPELTGLSGPEAEAFYLGTNAIIWGYPSVLFEQLMRGRTSPDIVARGNPQSAVNQFGLVRDLRGPEFKQIATPNNDTVYAQSFVDVSREPMVLSVPAVPAPRYYTFQLWDPNGDTFGYVGSRTTGRDETLHWSGRTGRAPFRQA